MRRAGTTKGALSLRVRRNTVSGCCALKRGMPAATQKALATIGWKLGASDGGFGRYQAIERWPGRYASAADMRADGLALAY